MTRPEPGACSICGDTEPVHVHNDGRQIEDYFVVGRGEDEMTAARRWKDRALDAEAGAGGGALDVRICDIAIKAHDIAAYADELIAEAKLGLGGAAEDGLAAENARLREAIRILRENWPKTIPAPMDEAGGTGE